MADPLANLQSAFDTFNAKVQLAGAKQLASSLVPSGGTFVQGVSAVITTTTAVDILAAPAAGNHLVITRVLAINITGTEIGALMLLDSTPADLCPIFTGDPAVAQQGFAEVEFPMGLICASAKKLQAKAMLATTGDQHVYAEGYWIAD